MTRQHTWTVTVADQLTRVETCLRCGLLRVVTMNGEHFFTRLDRQFAVCPSPYRERAVADSAP
jgi:hypothetical protein